MVERYEPSGEPSSRSEPAWLGQGNGLSERESQVLLLCADGLTNREIAEALYVNVETVRSHLKRAYQRLGLRNRAQAAAYVQRVLSAGAMGAGTASWLIGHPPAAATARLPGNVEPLQPADPAAIAERLHLLGLDGGVRARLRAHLPAVEQAVDAYATRQILRWRGPAETARVLTAHGMPARLLEHQRRYVHDLFSADYGERHVTAMLETGATHHRQRLPPQWYLASCAHLVCDHLPIILGTGPAATATEGAERVEAVIALVNSVLFDASLVLDGYELAQEGELRPAVAPAEADTHPGASRREPARPGARRSAARAPLTPDDATSRLAFIGLGRAEAERIRAVAPTIGAAVPAILEQFYALLAQTESLAELVPPAVVERLRVPVARYWSELAAGIFDEAYAATRLRVGVVHERVGLSPQLYLAGLAVQVAGLLRAVGQAEPAPLATFGALLRAVFFDLTFVLDAYLDARANALLQISRFANQVVAGLAHGVAVVDQRNRIEYANEELLAIVGVPPGVLRRLPLASALPLAGIDELVGAARAATAGRATALYDLNDRRFRVTAIRLDNVLAAPAGLVALVVDDISEVLRAASGLGQEHQRLDHVLSSLDALVWEMRRDDHTILAASSGALAVTGQREADLIGRRSLVDQVHEDDRARFTDACNNLRTGQRAEVDHRLQRGDEVVRALTSMVATVDPAGQETLCGVTVLLLVDPEPPREPHERFAEILLAHSRQAALDVTHAAPDDRLDGELFTIRAVEHGLLHLLGLAEPLVVPQEATDLAEVGWELRGDLLRRHGRWHLAALDNVSR